MDANVLSARAVIVPGSSFSRSSRATSQKTEWCRQVRQGGCMLIRRHWHGGRAATGVLVRLASGSWYVYQAPLTCRTCVVPRRKLLGTYCGETTPSIRSNRPVNTLTRCPPPLQLQDVPPMNRAIWIYIIVAVANTGSQARHGVASRKFPPREVRPLASTLEAADDHMKGPRRNAHTAGCIDKLHALGWARRGPRRESWSWG
ncbi:hypothetical protein P171DRAFT_155455 [Karstenula rhodostoma CBS 690.94]|uniref:Uncharacterized protein n=1 Tax=Karstenula rhodostoma CBS 690.94 TaxID=1392251 RepID=A0A9P4P7L4_9PLEO|nr:hypothetical protein P171DRAFT_155455 [Karstenula rhodostoma CBS 690.94]